MPAVNVVPTTNKLITDAVLLENLTVSQLVKLPPTFLQLQNSLLCSKIQSFVPILKQITPVHGPILSVKDPF